MNIPQTLSRIREILPVLKTFPLQKIGLSRTRKEDGKEEMVLLLQLEPGGELRLETLSQLLELLVETLQNPTAEVRFGIGKEELRELEELSEENVLTI